MTNCAVCLDFPVSGRHDQYAGNGPAGSGDELLTLAEGGKFLYYTKWARGNWRKPVQGGQETLLMQDGTPYHWGVFDRGSCLIDAAALGPTINCLDFDSNRVATVCSLPKSTRINEEGPSFSISHDGRSILYVNVERQESDIMVIETSDRRGRIDPSWDKTTRLGTTATAWKQDQGI